ncbi:MAG: hypothetical protein Ct9H300mP1_20900 [Planctomycetaceae bacterium]|nr:MAG: hypothetical protein Ct9H300mP1_20900 [Planctomycetaceae bacterium]
MKSTETYLVMPARKGQGTKDYDVIKEAGTKDEIDVDTEALVAVGLLVNNETATIPDFAQSSMTSRS